MDAVAHVLLWFRPDGDSGRRSITLSSGTDKADELMDKIRSADPSLPITPTSTPQHALAMLRDKLGSLAKVPHPYEDWRKTEPPLRIDLAKPASRKIK